jgi:predicted metal-dependent hydrolase
MLAVTNGDIRVCFIHNENARRYILRVRDDRIARVTIPRRGSIKAAREFLQKNVEWIERQLERIAERPKEDRTWRAGSQVLFRGETMEIRCETDTVIFGCEKITVGRDVQDLRSAIEAHMRSIAAVELPPRVFEFAHQHGLTVQRVSVRNQKSRWGSCSRRGTISLNWRLIQTPRFVSDYIELHELMHLRQMNHSRKFWREVESVCPGFREAERWLKQHASMLR